MPFEITVTIPDLNTVLDQAIIKANNAAIPVVAAKAVAILRANVPAKTGLMRTQTKFRLLRASNKLIWAVLRVFGKRAFVNHILEYGAKSHGGTGTKGKKVPPGAFGDRGPIEARHTFENTFNQIQSDMIATYDTVFNNALK